MNKRPELGILTCRSGSLFFAEEGFFRRLSHYGARQGIQVIVFSPKDYQIHRKMVYGATFSRATQTWKWGLFPLPRLVYDRCFYGARHRYREYKPWIKRLQATPGVQFLGLGLFGKWEVYSILKQHAELVPYLPPTLRLDSLHRLRTALTSYNHLIIKPHSGSRGAGILRISREAGGYSVKGRNPHNHIIHRFFASLPALLQFCTPFLIRKYLIQPYLKLRTTSGLPYDVRALVQKNRMGHWELTGMAIRQGRQEGLTANLHGGGRALPLHPFLRRHFPTQYGKLEAELNELCLKVPPLLEASHGPLVELGLDFGIEPDGRVWLIEANSKPGRSVFPRSGDRETAKKTISRIIDFSQFLLEKGGKV